MIDTLKITPSIYSKESRDYQLIGRLYNAVFNYAKMSIDGMNNFPLSKDSDKRFLDLVAKTIGFESKHSYNTENLYALCSSFKKIVSHKGTKKAIEELLSVLLNSQNINKLFKVDVYTNNNTGKFKPYSIVIYVPTELNDIIMLEDMMSYILPAGFVYEIYVSDIEETDDLKNDFSFEASVKVVEGTSSQLSRIESYINTSVVVGAPTPKDLIDTTYNTTSGKEYVNTKKVEEEEE